MERRKIFSAPEPVRRKIFSDVPVRRKIFSDNSVGKSYCCGDCGFLVTTQGGTTNLICPRCGGNRFNYAQPESVFQESGKEIKERRKIFCSQEINKSGDNGVAPGQKLGTMNDFKCLDCSTEFQSQEALPEGVRCPHCGGDRVVLIDSVPAEDDATDEFLKGAAGSVMNEEDVQKEFSSRGITESIDSLVNSGYAKRGENSEVMFSEDSYTQRKLFSKLVISVTKELHLDPVDDKEAMIHRLVESGGMPDKSICLIRKAHNLPDQVSFSEDAGNEYLKDSGIENDLRLEYGGTTVPIKEFMAILEEQYDDAPDNLLDLLVSAGVIKIFGSQVEILK